MKMRQVAAGITICILAFIMGAVAQIRRAGGENTADMVWYNGEVKAVESELKEGSTREASEAAHGCEILFLADEDYQSRLNRYLADGDMVLDFYQGGSIAGKAVWHARRDPYEAMRKKLAWEAALFGGLVLVAVYAVLAVLYRSYIKPFRTLQAFTAQVAKGNLELTLPVRRNNFFGAFTESFDIMRQELKRARESEYRANVSKKELIAELSHDIKTPVATIKATCEVLQVTEEKEDTLHKIGVIAGKAEMIDHLVGNLFHATMEELKMLKVEAVEESSLAIPEMFGDFKYYGLITLENEIPECLLYMDKLRLQQVIDNIVNNSYKYAGTEVRVRFHETDEGLLIQIRDFGPGASGEELALLKEKFYRGRNAAGKSGSGLGLYLADNFMEQMGGGMECAGGEGFVVRLFLRKA